MGKKIQIMLTLLFFGLAVNSQTSSDLPFEEFPTYKTKKTSLALIASKMLDSIGHEYYWVTKHLLESGSDDAFASKNIPRVYLNGFYVFSSKLKDRLIAYRGPDRQYPVSPLNDFRLLRKRTLYNIKEASDHFKDNPESAVNIQWPAFFELINEEREYIDALIDHAKDIGLNMEQDIFKKHSIKSASQAFEEQLGADGVTNGQWMSIMKFGGGPDGHAKLARQRRINTVRLSQLKKDEVTGKVETKELQQINPYSRRVEDRLYTYYLQPPNQISFAYSQDLELLQELVDWIISINAGRSAALSEIFRIGLNDELRLFEKDILNTAMTNRSITDSIGSRLALTIPVRYVNNDSYWDIPIDKVLMNKKGHIQFIRENPEDDPYGKKEVVVLDIKGIDGNLIDRLKTLIDIARTDDSAVDYSLLQLQEN